jgi:hypothetical protein
VVCRRAMCTAASCPHATAARPCARMVLRDPLDPSRPSRPGTSPINQVARSPCVGSGLFRSGQSGGDRRPRRSR